MQFEVNLRDGATYVVDASYVEVYDGFVSSTFTLIGPVPGYPMAILAVFPVDVARSVTPVIPRPTARRLSRDDERSR